MEIVDELENARRMWERGKPVLVGDHPEFKLTHVYPTGAYGLLTDPSKFDEVEDAEKWQREWDKLRREYNALPRTPDFEEGLRCWSGDVPVRMIDLGPTGGWIEGEAVEYPDGHHTLPGAHLAQADDTSKWQNEWRRRQLASNLSKHAWLSHSRWFLELVALVSRCWRSR